MDQILDKKYVKVLRGASHLLVTHREQRNSYQTNRSIKTWATYFLLKSLSTPSIIKTWVEQKYDLLEYCRMSEGCFRTRLQEMKQLGLLTISRDSSIHLVSFKQAAAVLGIPYTGTVKIEYDEKLPGKQTFQFHIVLDEIHCNQQKQIEVINYKVNKNPQLREVLQAVMVQHGADGNRLKQERYFQEYLLKLQLHFFRTGSDIWTVISQLRADINRSVHGIKKQYGYRSAQSVSYLKNRLNKLKIAIIKKTKVESDVGTRLYVPDEQGKRREAARYCRQTNRTVLFLCDAIIPKIQIVEPRTKQKDMCKHS